MQLSATSISEEVWQREASCPRSRRRRLACLTRKKTAGGYLSRGTNMQGSLCSTPAPRLASQQEVEPAPAWAALTDTWSLKSCNCRECFKTAEPLKPPPIDTEEFMINFHLARQSVSQPASVWLHPPQTPLPSMWEHVSPPEAKSSIQLKLPQMTRLCLESTTAGRRARVHTQLYQIFYVQIKVQNHPVELQRFHASRKIEL